MVKKLSIPERGDILWLSLDPAKGHEQRGRRPAIVVSSNYFNKLTHLIWVCPITSQDKKYFHHIPTEAKNIKGFVMCEHLRSIDYKARDIEFVEKGSHILITNVRNCSQAILEL